MWGIMHTGCLHMGWLATKVAPQWPAATKSACADCQNQKLTSARCVRRQSLQPAQAGFVAERGDAHQARF